MKPFFKTLVVCFIFTVIVAVLKRFDFYANYVKILSFSNLSLHIILHNYPVIHHIMLCDVLKYKGTVLASLPSYINHTKQKLADEFYT